MLVPFAYPDYPSEKINHQIELSQRALADAGMKVICTNAVIELDDIAPALTTLRQTEFDLIVAILVSWVEAPLFVATLRPFFSSPLLLWSHTIFTENGVGLTLGALPAAGVLRETLEEMQANFAFVYGMPDETKLVQDILALARPAAAIRALSSARIGLVGYASMGMYTGTIDHTQLRRQVGVEIDQIDQYELVERFHKIGDDQVQALRPQTDAWDLSSLIVNNDLSKMFRMYAAIKFLAEERRWNALTIKCQYELSRTFGLAPCMPLSILGDELVSSCEGDVPLVVSQLILHYLTGEPTSYGDLHNVTPTHTLWGACGFAPLSYAAGKPTVNKHTALYEGTLNSSPYKTGRVTLARLGAHKQQFKMHIATGTAELPPPFHEVGCPPYPFVNVAMDGDTAAFMQQLSSQHYALVYGDVRAELETVCQLLQIKAIVT
jgi:L-fucose isomerase